MPPRRAHWAPALDRYLASNRDRGFEYGSWDCFRFACGAIESMTGVDLFAQFLPYRTMLGARKQMLRFCGSIGFAAFARALMARAGFREIPSNMAQRGDVVMTCQPAFGIVALDGKHLLGVTERDGLIELPLVYATCGWRI